MIKSRNNERLVYGIGSLILFVYLICRAHYTPVLHDEGAIFFVNIQHGEWLPFLSDWEAGNHFFNSGLTIFFTKVFGTSVFTIRVASLLAFPVFVYFLFRICQSFQSLSLRVSVWLLFFGSTYLIEFFGYSRGYSWQLAGLLGGIYFGQKLLRNFTPALLLKASFFFSISAASILTSVVPYAMFFFVVVLVVLREKNFSFKRWSLVALAYAPLICFAFLGIIMNKLGVLYKGDQIGFYSTTITTLVKAFVGESSALVNLAIVCSLVSVLAIATLRWIKTKRPDEVFVEILLIGSIMISIIQVFVFDANYFEDRTGLFLYPLLVLAFVRMFDNEKISVSKVIPLIIGACSLLFMLMNVNISHSFYWHRWHYPESWYEFIKMDSPERKTTISADGVTRSPWAFYEYVNNAQYTSLASLENITPIADYIILEPGLLSDTSNYEILKRNESTRLCLMKRKNPLKRLPFDTLHIDIDFGDTRYFQRLLDYTFSDNHQTVVADLYLDVKSQDYSRGEIGFNLFSVEGDSININNIKLNAYGINQQNGIGITQPTILDLKHLNAFDLGVNLWNKKNSHHRIKGKIILSDYQ